MSTTSAKTIRIRGIAADTSQSRFEVDCVVSGSLNESRPRFSWSSPFVSSPSPTEIRTSLARQSDSQTATVTFQTEQLKSKALLQSYPAEWVLDDQFNGLTILHTPDEDEDINVDICAIHGLHGNGFDTWTADNGVMWLRDLLPQIPSFKKSRVMTFGYSSQLTNKLNISDVRDWSDHLLSKVGMARESASQCQRLIIFVCHSLGGIVAREAMVRLNAHPEKYDGIRVEHCGLLFLGTPHSGTVQADWNEYIAGIVTLFGVRTDILDSLRSFNGFGVESKEAFGSISAKPPYYCLCETRLIEILGNSRLVVQKDSAGLNGVVAFPMPDADHRGMCRFLHKHQDGFELVVKRLDQIRNALQKKLPKLSTDTYEELPGHPPITAPQFPLPKGKTYYEGRGLLGLGKARLIGRKDEHHQLELMMENLLDSTTGHTAIAVSGIGGIGKTELLLSIAHRYRNICNIFLLKANGKSSIKDEYLSIAESVGPDLLANRFPNQDLFSIWSSLKISERVDSLKRWLTEPSSSTTVIMIDDIDGLSELALADSLPQQARNILVTTRNPVLIRWLAHEYHLKFNHLGLVEMRQQDMLAITTEAVQVATNGEWSQGWTSDQIKAVADVAAGHPLIAWCIVFYIMTNFVEQHGRQLAVTKFVTQLSNSPAQRKVPPAVFGYKPLLRYSILDNFEISKKRLPDTYGYSWMLMQLIAFMVQDDFAFLDFLFLGRVWIAEFSEELFYDGIWSAEEFEIRTWLSHLRQVSLGTPDSVTDRLRFHPVLIQSIQEELGQEGRTTIIRDIIVVASESAARLNVCYSENPISTTDMLQKQVNHCMEVCAAYGIDRKDLDLPCRVTRL